MQRLAIVLCGVLIGAFGGGSSSALAGGMDWAVNGAPLAPGQEVAVKFASTSPVQLNVPERGIEVTCSTWKGNGTLVGGETGSGELPKPKLSHCLEASGQRVKIKLGAIGLRPDLEPPPGAGDTTEFVFPVCEFKKPRSEELQMTGVVDSFGPQPGEQNLLEFPSPSLEATTLTIGGSPAQLTAHAVLILPRHAELSQAEL